MIRKNNKLRFLLPVTTFLLFWHTPDLLAQEKTAGFEVGGQFSIIRLQDPLFRPHLPASEVSYTIESGAGARVTYHLNRNFSLESEINFFPRNTNEFRGGSKVQGLFGLKVGKRGSSYGVFGKLRPGFVHFEREEVRFLKPVTDFALDMGGVFEVYPTRRTVLRFDVGDTLIRRNVVDRTPLPPGNSLLKSFESNTHNLQVNIGIGFRF